MSTLPIAYSYVRFSTSEQKKGDSLRRQTELSEEYAKSNGLTLDTSLHLHDLGLSAYDRSNIDRGALGGFLEAVKLGRISPGSYLLVESLDRLSRDKVLAALQIFISILQQGITIVTLADKMVYNTDSVGDNFGSLIISITIMARAHEESATKSRRLKAVWENKRANIAEKKLTRQCPRWMRLKTDRSEFELIPERAKLVLEIISLVKAGMGQAQIVKRFNERSEPSFSEHGHGWHSSYIHAIVTSKALYGELQLLDSDKLLPRCDPFENYYPALITKEEFHLLQNIRSQRMFRGGRAKKGTTIPNLLSGVAKCGYCGSSMVLINSTTKPILSEDGTATRSPTKKLLVCNDGRRGLNCYAIQWNYKDFERSFLTFCRTLQLQKLLTDADVIEGEKVRDLTINEQLQSINSIIEDSKKRLDRLTAALELGDTPNIVLNRIRELETVIAASIVQKEHLEQALKTSELSNQHRAIEIESVRELIDNMDSFTGEKLFMVRATLAEHIRHLIEVVRFYPAGTLETLETIQFIRSELIEDGYPPERVDAHIAEAYRTEPKRAGSGTRGRYAMGPEIGRYFIIKAKNGGYRTVYPDFGDPSEVKVEMGDRVGYSLLLEIPR